MTRITIIRDIKAPIEKVFTSVADISEFSRIIPDVVRVEYLTENRKGVGARFIETRLMNKKEASIEFEVTELVENDHVRLVSEAGGTVWDTIFSVKEKNGFVELSMVMDAKASNIFADLMNKIFKKMMTKAIAKDMDQIKKHCENLKV